MIYFVDGPCSKMVVFETDIVIESAFAHQNCGRFKVHQKEDANDIFCVLHPMLAGNFDGSWSRDAGGAAWLMQVCNFSKPNS